MAPVELPNINPVIPQVLISNVHDQWITAKTYCIAHERARRNKTKFFNFFAGVTLIASIVTVVLSGFGLTTEPQSRGDNQSVASEARILGLQDNVKSADDDSTRVVWFFTTAAAVCTTVAKICEQYIGRPEDIQRHQEVQMNLNSHIHSLDRLAAGIVDYSERGTSDLEKLRVECQRLEDEVNKVIASFPIVETAQHAFQAQEEVRKSMVERLYQRLHGQEQEVTEEIPHDAPGIVATQRRIQRTVEAA